MQATGLTVVELITSVQNILSNTQIKNDYDKLIDQLNIYIDSHCWQTILSKQPEILTIINLECLPHNKDNNLQQLYVSYKKCVQKIYMIASTLPGSTWLYIEQQKSILSNIIMEKTTALPHKSIQHIDMDNITGNLVKTHLIDWPQHSKTNVLIRMILNYPHHFLTASIYTEFFKNIDKKHILAMESDSHIFTTLSDHYQACKPGITASAQASIVIFNNLEEHFKTFTDTDWQIFLPKTPHALNNILAFFLLSTAISTNNRPIIIGNIVKNIIYMLRKNTFQMEQTECIVTINLLGYTEYYQPELRGIVFALESIYEDYFNRYTKNHTLENLNKRLEQYPKQHSDSFIANIPNTADTLSDPALSLWFICQKKSVSTIYKLPCILVQSLYKTGLLDKKHLYKSIYTHHHTFQQQSKNIGSSHIVNGLFETLSRQANNISITRLMPIIKSILPDTTIDSATILDCLNQHDSWEDFLSGITQPPPSLVTPI